MTLSKMADGETLVARLRDGSVHVIDLDGNSPTEVLKRITDLVPRPDDWTKTEDGGRIRTSAIIALTVQETRTAGFS